MPFISCIGVGKLALIGASKVQKDYFGTHLLKELNSSAMREALIEGLAQAEVDCNIPSVHIQKSFSDFIKYDLDRLFPIESTHRFIAHPILPPTSRNVDDLSNPMPNTHRMFDFLNSDGAIVKTPKATVPNRVVVVIGPEGGWINSEIESFIEKGFNLINLGERILRTDMAVSLTPLI